MSNQLVGDLSKWRDPAITLYCAFCRPGEGATFLSVWGPNEPNPCLEIPRGAGWISEPFTQGKCLVAVEPHSGALMRPRQSRPHALEQNAPHLEVRARLTRRRFPTLDPLKQL
jgi:hypothetical protein